MGMMDGNSPVLDCSRLGGRVSCLGVLANLPCHPVEPVSLSVGLPVSLYPLLSPCGGCPRIGLSPWHGYPSHTKKVVTEGAEAIPFSGRVCACIKIHSLFVQETKIREVTDRGT